MGDQILRQPVEEVRVPGGVLHDVDGLDQAAAQEARPEPVHDGPGQAAVLGMEDELGEAGDAVGPRGVVVDVPEFREQELHRGMLPSGLKDEFEFLVGVDAGHAVGVGELPVVDEAVVAGGALEVHAEEDLGDVLGGLHLRGLRGIDGAAPDDAFDEAARGAIAGVHELPDKLVVRPVVTQGGVEPLGDGFAAAIDVAGALEIISEQVVPEGEPVLGVPRGVAEQLPDQLLAAIRALVRQEGVEFPGSGQEADDVEIRAAGEGGVADRAGRCDLVRSEVGGQEAVDGMGGRWQRPGGVGGDGV